MILVARGVGGGFKLRVVGVDDVPEFLGEDGADLVLSVSSNVPENG